MRHLAGLATLSFAIGCGGATPGRSEQAERFAAAQAVFVTTSAQCHAPFLDRSEEDWQTFGMVVPGDAAQSPLYRFLKGSQVGGPETMPREGTISAEQRDQIKQWIDGMLGDEPAGSEAFRAATVVIASNCIKCHSTGTGLPSFMLSTETDWVNSGFVIPGRPSDSYLVQRISGAKLGVDAETMPFDLPPIRSEDLFAIQNWILTMPLER